MSCWALIRLSVPAASWLSSMRPASCWRLLSPIRQLLTIRLLKQRSLLTGLIDRYKVELIVIGNGTASRETEQFIADLINKRKAAGSTGASELKYIIVNEAGASVYSASKLAAEEFPALDVAERSAVSIARRLQDPLAELVKIEPKAIGVGQYQHDVSQKRLEESLAESSNQRLTMSVST